MTEILQFPTKTVRDWRLFEETVRSIVAEAPLDATASDTIVARLRPFFDLCNRSLDLSVDLPFPPSLNEVDRQGILKGIDAGVRGYERWVQDLVKQLALERLQLEIRRYAETLSSC